MDTLIHIKELLLVRRRALIVCFNIALTVAAFVFAMACRFDFYIGHYAAPEYWATPLAVLVAGRLAAYAAFDLNRGYWRYTSTPEAWKVFEAHALSSASLAAVVVLLDLPLFSRAVVVLEFVISLLMALGARLAVRSMCERWLRCEAEEEIGRAAVVIGAGFAAQCLIELMLTQKYPPFRITAVFDDHNREPGAKIHRVPIVGPISGLRTYLLRHPKIAAVLLALPEISTVGRKHIERTCGELDVPLKDCTFENLLSRENTRHHSVEELLRCRTSVEDQEEVAEALRGKRVAITGAGGSIGSELVQQVLRYDPSEVVLIDKSEFNLYSAEQTVGALLATNHFSAPPQLKYYLADLVDREHLLRIFDRHRPELVLHAAAYKHVPLLEKNSCEAFRNNVIGTLNILRACKRCRARRFVQISTDKAVAPANVMGATKRICELMVQQANSSSGARVLGRDGSHHLETAVVRFGNVINSAGSVVPLFTSQILAGGPITVTHPDVERYFMSIREAAGLVLIAGTLGRQGEIFMLDMGEPVKLVEVARKMRALYGRRDIPIVFTGLRPGEKLTEELHSDLEEREETSLHKVFRVRVPTAPAPSVFDWVAAMAQTLPLMEDHETSASIMAFVRNEAAYGLEHAADEPVNVRWDMLGEVSN